MRLAWRSGSGGRDGPPLQQGKWQRWLKQEQQSGPLTAGVARRTRARAAVVMIVASLSTGFLLGRASIWVVPLGVPAVRIVDRQPAVRASAGAQELEEPAALVPLDKAGVKALETTLDRSSTVVSRALSPSGDPSAAGFGVLVGASRPTVLLQSMGNTFPRVAILNLGNADAGRDAQDTAPSRPESAVGVDSSSGLEKVPPASNSTDAQYWLNLAEGARLQATEMTHPAAKREMRKIADAYRRLAQHATEETVDKKPRRRRRG